MSGRPSTYDPAYCEQAITHCAEGASLTSFAAEIGVCRDTISEWAKVHDEFSVAVKRAKAACAKWWEDTARKAAKDGGGNATLCIFGLKNMAAEDWKDRQLLGSDPENPLPASVNVTYRDTGGA